MGMDPNDSVALVWFEKAGTGKGHCWQRCYTSYTACQAQRRYTHLLPGSGPSRAAPPQMGPHQQAGPPGWKGSHHRLANAHADPASTAHPSWETCWALLRIHQGSCWSKGSAAVAREGPLGAPSERCRKLKCKKYREGCRVREEFKRSMRGGIYLTPLNCCTWCRDSTLGLHFLRRCFRFIASFTSDEFRSHGRTPDGGIGT
jgi:hypothetical protein